MAKIGNCMTVGGNDAGLFPSSPRVFYKLAPLQEVICQIRFPPVLRIESQVPDAFQEQVRKAFPFFEQAMVAGLPQQLPPGIAQLLSAQIGASGYQFRTEDQASTVLLTNDSISLTTSSYQSWEAFVALFEVPMRALTEIYDPSFFSRIGLRYRNLIDKDALGLETAQWARLLRNELVGELGFEGMEEAAQDVRRMIRLAKPPSGSVLIQHGFSTNGNVTTKSSYVLDFDFSTDAKTDTTNARQALDGLHQGAGDAFRWSITEELHNWLQPVPC